MRPRNRNVGNWKKKLTSIDYLIDKINFFENNLIVLSSVMKINASSIKKGHYNHLGISFVEDKIEYPQTIIPPSTNGKFSLINTHGKEIVHKDLPKITKTYSWEAPNYGDPSNGYHDILMDREVYQRSYIGEKNLQIKIELMAEESTKSGTIYVFKFILDELLNRKDPHFKNDLYFNANLLQENVGKVDAFPSDADQSDYLRTVYLEWEILPPGTREETVARIINNSERSLNPEIQKRVKQRYNIFSKLDPQEFIVGKNGFRRYFGAKFTDNFVAFENLDYGNALYIMYGNWQVLSKLSRTELLRGDHEGFERIVHTSSWEEKLKRILSKHRQQEITS